MRKCVHGEYALEILPNANGNNEVGDYIVALKEELEKAVESKKALVIVGAGVASATTNNAPCATWRGLLKHGIQYCRNHNLFDDKRIRLLSPLLDSSEIDDHLHVGEQLTRALGGTKGGDFYSWLENSVGSLKVVDDGIIAALAALELPLATTNYDSLIEAVTGLPPVRWDEHRMVEQVLRGDTSRVLHLHGFWQEPKSVVLGTRSYFEIEEDEHAQNIQHALRTYNSLIFVGFGAGLSDPNFGPLIDWSRRVFYGSAYRHYRLLLKQDCPSQITKQDQEARIFPIAYGTDHADLAPFLESIAPSQKKKP
jgi:hypothetical protein